MNRKVLVILLITIISLVGIPQVQANKNIKNNFTTLYNVPNVSEAKLNTCITCMATTSPASWNKYGQDLKGNSAYNRNSPIQALKNIELLDSDGDKFINIDEIHNSTLPGNDSDFPKIQVTPIQQIQPSPTVTLTQKQTPTKTEPKSAYTIMNGFATISMFAVVYFLVVRKNRK